MMKNLPKVEMDNPKSFSKELSDRLNSVKCGMSGVLDELRPNNIGNYDILWIMSDIQRTAYFFVVLMMDTDVYLTMDQKNMMSQINNIFTEIVNIINSNKNQTIYQCNLVAINDEIKMLLNMFVIISDILSQRMGGTTLETLTDDDDVFVETTTDILADKMSSINLSNNTVILETLNEKLTHDDDVFVETTTNILADKMSSINLSNTVILETLNEKLTHDDVTITITYKQLDLSLTNLLNDKVHKRSLTNNLSGVTINYDRLQNRYEHDKWHNILDVSQYHKDAPD